MATIFISHQRDDKEVAFRLSQFLKERGISSYLDILDPSINTLNLTNRIRQALDGCTHLIVVLSKSTQLSWWVPFEIGIATDKEKPIANLLIANIEIPAFLMTWPYLRTDQDLEQYVSVVNMNLYVLEKSATAGLARYPDRFHDALKRKLGQ
jgi:hypothetical protein